MAYGFIRGEVVNVGEAPYKHVVSAAVTQARLAEPIKILQQDQGWYQIEMSDTYRGWVSPVEVVITDKEFWEHYQSSAMVLVTAHFTYIYTQPDFTPLNKDANSIVSGATLATMLKLLATEDDHFHVLLPDGRDGYLSREHGMVITRFNEIPRRSIDAMLSLAKEFIGLPYYWAGTTPYGYDCSGFMQTMYKMNGVHLLRDADQQYEMGEVVEERAKLEKGDMVFFSTYKEGPSHVGIYIGNDEYIHSGGKGIAINSFRPEAENYSEPLDKKYLGAKRLVL
jgi:cell wall-associated NlpC family hydrolase